MGGKKKIENDASGKVVKMCSDSVPLPGQEGLPGFPGTLLLRAARLASGIALSPRA